MAINWPVLHVIGNTQVLPTKNDVHSRFNFKRLENLEDIDSSNPSAIIFDLNSLSGSEFRKIRELKKLKQRKILLFAGLSQNYDLYDQFHHQLSGLVDNYYLANNPDSLNRTLRHSINLGKFSLIPSIGLIGSGRAGWPIASEISKLSERYGLDWGWYSENLSNRKYIGFKEKNIGYEEITKLFPDTRKLNVFDNIEDFIKANYDILIYAHQIRFDLPINPEKRFDEDEEENSAKRIDEDVLFEKSYKMLDKIGVLMKKHNSTSLVMIVSNPPEALAYRLKKIGIDKNKITTIANDRRRASSIVYSILLDKNRINKEDEVDAVIFGPHYNPGFDMSLVKINKKLIKERFNNGIGIVISKSIEDIIHGYGPDVFSTGLAFTDLAYCLHDTLKRIIRFQSPISLGYFNNFFNSYFFGPTPQVDFSDLKVRPYMGNVRSDPRAIEAYRFYKLLSERPDILIKLKKQSEDQINLALKYPLPKI